MTRRTRDTKQKTNTQVALNDGQDLSSNDRELFENLREQLERIEPSIDPYSDPEWLEQWTLCIGEVIRRQRANNNNNQDGESRRHEPQHNSTGKSFLLSKRAREPSAQVKNDASMGNGTTVGPEQRISPHHTPLRSPSLCKWALVYCLFGSIYHASVCLQNGGVIIRI